MKRMWSPWRSQHLDALRTPEHGQGGEESLFTRLAEDDRDDENFVVYRGRRVFVVMNLYPYNNGHLLIVPYREVAWYRELDDEERNEMTEVLNRCLEWLNDALEPEGFNVGMNIGKAAGAGIPEHLHMHVVPRWSGDTNFMPATGDVKVIPEAMQDTFAKIKRAAQRSD